jgi:cyanophycinase-like exopeptidase
VGIGSRKEDLEGQSSTSSIISAAFTGSNTDSVVEDANSHAVDVGKESFSRSARMSADNTGHTNVVLLDQTFHSRRRLGNHWYQLEVSHQFIDIDRR